MLAEDTPSSEPISPVLTFFLGWAVLAVAFAITSWLIDGMEVSGGVGGYIWVSAIFGLVNAIIGTILRIFTLPPTPSELAQLTRVNVQPGEEREALLR